ncbi:hypothetical protein ACFX15_025713 [Malus domestica]
MAGILLETHRSSPEFSSFSPVPLVLHRDEGERLVLSSWRWCLWTVCMKAGVDSVGDGGSGCTEPSSSKRSV